MRPGTRNGRARPLDALVEAYVAAHAVEILSAVEPFAAELGVAGGGADSDDPPSHTSEVVRCPSCGWVPSPLDRWECDCGMTWNTFDTRGRCPACGVEWETTDCLSCAQASPHGDWYAPPAPRRRP